MRGDLEWGSTPGLLRAAVERFGDREAIVDGDVRLSFADLETRVAEAARAVVASGLQPGDRAGIWAPNAWEWVVAALAIHHVGGVVVPLNTRYKGREAGDILDRSQARLLFTVTGFLDTDYVGLLRDANGPATDTRPARDLTHLEQVVVLRGDAPAGTVSWDDFLAAGAAVSADEVRRRADAVTADDLCDIMFTSGTTGQPKGVMATHGQTLRVFAVWSDVVGLAEGDRYLIVNPFFHTFGYKAGWLACLMRGATVVPHPVFDADAVLRRIGEEQISVLPGPPALYQSILNHPKLDAHDLSSLRLAVTGAASIPVSLIERMRDDLGFDRVLTAYGLTEATGTVTMCRDGDDPVTIATTSGCAIPDTEVRVVDEDGNALPPGTPGEVVVKGYNVMQGYLDDPEQTAATIVDGWLHTGDIGVLDERGYLDITDRKKDMFIVGGFNAYPAEIENDLSDHEAVAQVAVVGMPDERLGEVGCAFVVPRSGTSPDPDAIIAWCRERMANFKVPRRVEIVEALPANASGKVLKHELRDRVAR